jgi:hypothetical protein
VSGLDLVLGLLVPRDITAFLQAIWALFIHNLVTNGKDSARKHDQSPKR